MDEHFGDSEVFVVAGAWPQPVPEANLTGVPEISNEQGLLLLTASRVAYVALDLPDSSGSRPSSIRG